MHYLQKEEESKKIIENLIENYQESPYSDEIITCESKEKLCELKLIYIFEKGHDEDSLNYANELLGEYPDNILAMLIQAKILFKNNQKNKDLKIFKKKIKK